MCCYAAKNRNAVPAGSLKYLVAWTDVVPPMLGGFVSFRVYETYMNVVYHDEKGNDLWTSPNLSPRK
jgi:hypothetical protein